MESDGELGLDLTSYYATVRRYVGRFATRACSADDLAQETFSEAYRSLVSCDRPTNPKAWLLTIAYRTAMDQYRKERTRCTALAMEPSSSEPSPVDKLCELERCGELERAIEELRPDQQELVRCFYYRDLGTREIADDLGVSPLAVRLRLYRARQDIRRRLQP